VQKAETALIAGSQILHAPPRRPQQLPSRSTAEQLSKKFFLAVIAGVLIIVGVVLG
jgi:hypothetical protein